MRIRSLLVAALAAGLVASGPTSAFAAEGTLRTESVAVADAADISLTLAPDRAVLTDTKSPLGLTALIEVAGKGELPEGELTFELSRTPVTSVAELTEPGEVRFTSLGTAPVGTTLPDKPTSSTLRVAGEDLPFTASTTAGTYLLRVSLAVNGDQMGSTVTPIVWKNAGAKAAVDVSVIVPFVLPERITTMPTRNELTKLTPAWDRLLDAAEAAKATLAIDPRIVAGIRAYGTEAPQVARDFLAKLEASSAPSFLLQFADADPAVQSALGFTSLLGPTNLEFVTRYGAFEATAGAAADANTNSNGTADSGDSAAGSSVDSNGASAAGSNGASNGGAAGSDGAAGTADASTGKTGAGTAGAGTAGAGESGEGQVGKGSKSAADGASDSKNSKDSGADGDKASAKDTGSDGTGADGTDGTSTDDADLTPDLAQLMAWHGNTVAWPAEGDVDSKTINLLKRAGFSSVVLDSDNVKLHGGPRIPLAQGDAVVTNAGLSEQAAIAMGGAEEVDRLEAEAKLAGELALRAQAGGSGVVIGLDRATVADVEDPALILDEIAALDFVKPVGVAEQQPGTGSLKAAESLEERRALLRSASDREASVNEMGAVLVQPQFLSGYQRTRLLQLFATRYAPADGGFAAASEAYQQRDSELLEGVQAISTEHTQLVGVTTSVPIQLHNSLPFTAKVTVTAVPTSAAIEVKQQVFEGVKIAAGANERVQVPVHSRVSSGESGLVVTVSAPGGSPTVFTGTFELSIASNVETIALWIVGVMAGLLLVFGVVRSVRRKRRAAAEAAAALESEAGSAVADSAAGSPSGSPSADAE